ALALHREDPGVQGAEYETAAGSASESPLQPASFSTPSLPPPFEGVDVVTAEALAEQVIARNPTMAEMIATWQAASARYPQVTSLDDPNLGLTVAPGSIGSNTVEFGYRVELSQKFPYPGKLNLRGENSRAEANAALLDVADVRLQLVESAK